MKTIGFNTWSGLASETKPTTGMPAFGFFFETDTKKVYQWVGSEWVRDVDKTIENGTDVTYFISQGSGDDTNDGLDYGTPFATFNKALELMNNTYFIDSTISLVIIDGTFTDDSTRITKALNTVFIGTTTVSIYGNTQDDTKTSVSYINGDPVVTCSATADFLTNTNTDTHYPVVSSDGSEVIIPMRDPDDVRDIDMAYNNAVTVSASDLRFLAPTAHLSTSETLINFYNLNFDTTDTLEVGSDTKWKFEACKFTSDGVVVNCHAGVDFKSCLFVSQNEGVNCLELRSELPSKICTCGFVGLNKTANAILVDSRISSTCGITATGFDNVFSGITCSIESNDGYFISIDNNCVFQFNSITNVTLSHAGIILDTTGYMLDILVDKHISVSLLKMIGSPDSGITTATTVPQRLLAFDKSISVVFDGLNQEYGFIDKTTINAGTTFSEVIGTTYENNVINLQNVTLENSTDISMVRYDIHSRNDGTFVVEPSIFGGLIPEALGCNISFDLTDSVLTLNVENTSSESVSFWAKIERNVDFKTK